MKKYGVKLLASLALFFATGAAYAMERGNLEVCLFNRFGEPVGVLAKDLKPTRQNTLKDFILPNAEGQCVAKNLDELKKIGRIFLLPPGKLALRVAMVHF